MKGPPLWLALLVGVGGLFYYWEPSMGVIPCDRVGCNGIMCDQRIVGERVCDDCLTEFRNRYDRHKLTGEMWLTLFHRFMGTEPEFYEAVDGQSIDAFLEEHMVKR